jgi:hypothetical protein
VSKHPTGVVSERATYRFRFGLQACYIDSQLDAHTVRSLLTETTRTVPAWSSSLALLTWRKHDFVDGKYQESDEKCLNEESHCLCFQERTRSFGVIAPQRSMEYG